MNRNGSGRQVAKLSGEGIDYGTDPFLGHAMRPKRQRTQLADITVSIVLPWLVFFVIVCLFLFAFHDKRAVVWIVTSACMAFSLLFLLLGATSRNGTFVTIGLLSFTSVVAATTVGIWLNREYLTRYWELKSGMEYRDVDPMLDARKTSDASIIHFTNDTFVDDKRTIGFVAKGRIFCVAPVARPPQAMYTVEYWAVGEDCCEQRGNFNCGTARELDTVTAITERPSEVYKRAIAEALSVYGINTTRGAQLVSFVGDSQVVIGDIWDEALSVAVVAMMMDLCVCFLAGLVMSKVLMPPQQVPLLPRG